MFLVESPPSGKLDGGLTVKALHMAKPIRATPTLRVEDAVKFVKAMVKRENTPPSKQEREFLLEFKKNFKYLP